MRKKWYRVQTAAIAAAAIVFAAAVAEITSGLVVDERETEAEEMIITDEAEPTAEAATETTAETMSRDWDGADSERLMKIAMAEAEGETVEGKALVMLVVLNRVASADFPDTIEEVIMQKGQFSVVKDGGRYYTTEPDAGCEEALRLIESGWDESEGALYFESCKGESWQSRNLEFLFEVGGHRFYK